MLLTLENTHLKFSRKMNHHYYRLEVILLLFVLSLCHACTVFDLDPRDNNSRHGQLVPMGRLYGYNAIEVRIRPPTVELENGNFGFYFQNETHHDVAAVTVAYTKNLTVVSFYGWKDGEEFGVVHADYVKSSFFAEKEWVELYIMYERDNFEVQYPSKHVEKDNYDYPGPYDDREEENTVILSAWVTAVHELPLLMYPVVHSGPKLYMTYNCMDDKEPELPSTSFVEEHRIPSNSYGDDMYIYVIPEDDFEVGTLVLSHGDRTVHTQITKEDFAVGRYNLIQVVAERDRMVVYHTRDRRCLDEEALVTKELLELDSISFFSNSAFKWINQPRGGINLGIRSCEDTEREDCFDRFIGDEAGIMTTESVLLGSEFHLKKTRQDDRETDFSLWLQEQGLTLAGVRVRESGGGLLLEFYQVVNGTSYQLRTMVKLERLELGTDAWTPMVVHYQNHHLTVEFKGDSRLTSRGEMVLDHQFPLSVFLSSRKHLHIRIKCTEEEEGLHPSSTDSPSEPLEYEPSPTEKAITKSSGFVKAFLSPQYETNYYFRPGSGFKIATLFMADAEKRNILKIADIKESDVVMDKWNAITFYFKSSLGYLPSLEVPTKGECRIKSKILDPTFVKDSTRYSSREILLYSNAPSEWMFEDEPAKEDMAKKNGYSCAQNFASVCSVRAVGQPSFTPLRYKEGMTFRLRSSHCYEDCGIRMTLQDLSFHSHHIEIYNPDSDSFHLFSKSLAINETIDNVIGYGEAVHISLSVLPSKEVEVSLETINEGVKEWRKVKSRHSYSGVKNFTWLHLFPQAKDMTLEFPGHFSEKVTQLPMMNRTVPYVLADNEIFITFRSRLPSDDVTSLSLDLYSHDWQMAHTLELRYGGQLVRTSLVNSGPDLLLDLNLQPTKWTDMVLKKVGRAIKVAFWDSSEGRWEEKWIDFYSWEPYFVALKSMHSHEIIVNCKRKGSQMGTEKGDLKESYLIPSSHRFVWLKKLNEVAAPVVGQKSPLIFLSPHKINLCVMYFYHRNSKVSVVSFNGTSSGRLGAVLLDNAEEEDGVSKVNVPKPEGDEARGFQSLSHVGPVDRVSIYTSRPALWITPTCARSQESFSLPSVPLSCESESALEPFMTSVAAPEEDFLVVLVHGSEEHLQVLVHLVHDNEEISSRFLGDGHFRERMTWFQVRNVRKESDAASVKLVSDLGPDFEDLENKGPVKKLQVVSPAGTVCVTITSTLCK